MIEKWLHVQITAEIDTDRTESIKIVQFGEFASFSALNTIYKASKLTIINSSVNHQKLSTEQFVYSQWTTSSFPDKKNIHV